MKQAIHCNLLHGEPITDINACLDKINLTIVNIKVIFIIFENVGGFPQLSPNSPPKMRACLDWDI